MKNQAKYVYSLLVHYGLHPVTVAKWATAQAAFETGGFTSNIWHENKNAFGYKYVGQRLAVGESRGHAKYLKVSDSVLEFVGYYMRRRSRRATVLFSLSGYVEYLSRKDIAPGAFFEAPLSVYVAGCTYYYKEIFG